MANVRDVMANVGIEDLLFTNYGTYKEVNKCIDPQSDQITYMTKCRWKKLMLIVEYISHKTEE